MMNPMLNHPTVRRFWQMGMALVAALTLSSCTELDYLRTMTDEQRQQIDQMDKKLREWQEAYDSLYNQRVQREEDFRKQLLARDQEIRQLKGSKTDREYALQASENEMKLRLQQELDKNAKLTKDLADAQGRLTMQQKDLSSVKTTQGQTEKDLAAARMEAATFRTQAEKAESARQAAEKRAKASDAERVKLTSAAEDSNRKIKELEAGVAELQASAKSASDGKTTMSALVAELKKQLADARRTGDEERQKYKAEIARLSKEGTAKSPVASRHEEDPAFAEAKDELSRVLGDELKQKTAEVMSTPDRVVVRLRSDALFQPSSLILQQSAQAKLRQIAEILKKYPGYHLRPQPNRFPP